MIPYGDTDLGNIGSRNGLLPNDAKPLPVNFLSVTFYRWYSSENNVTADAQAIILYYEFENYIFRITTTAFNDQ